MTRLNFYSSIKIKLLKIGFVQLFLGLMEMINILIIYKIINLSIKAIQSNQRNVFISIQGIDIIKISLFKLLFFAFCYVLFKLFISILLTSLKNRTLTTITEEISSEIFYSYINMSFSKLNLINTSVLLQNIRGESVFLTRYLTAITLVFYESVTVLSLVIILFYIDIYLTLFIAIILITFGTIFLISTKNKLIYWGGLRHKYETKLINQIIETFDGIREVIIFGKRTLFTKLFKDVNKDKFNTENKNLNLSELPAFFLEFSFGISIFCLIAYFSIGNNLTFDFETLLVFPLAAYRILPGINRILSSIQNINFNKKSVKNIKDILQNEFVNTDFKNNINFNEIESINFVNVSFSYNSKHKVINQLNFTIKKNAILGIHGPSGSGKSTFIDLVSGLLTPDSGSILINGLNLSNNNISSYQECIGYVSQSAYMLQGTLIDNILFEDEDEYNLNSELLLECCAKANIDFVNLNLQSMREFIITDKGTNISGGQKQRIALARALYKKPEILILDEFTSALDNKNEEVLLDSIKSISMNKIIIIISHKKSTLDICNELLKTNKLKNYD
jgi:ATP-binding cassette subfamily C protein